MVHIILACTIAILTISFIGYIIKGIIKPRNFPPGPSWYPFTGCSNVVNRMSKQYGSQWRALFQLSREYSTQVLGLKLGSEKIVVVYGEKNVREVFTRKAFQGRPKTFFLKLRCLGKIMGITATDGPLWREHRHFTVKLLRNVGFGKTPMEETIQKEMFKLLNYIDNNNNKPIAPSSVISTAVMNVLWKYVAGEIIDEDKLKRLLKLFSVRSKAFSIAGGLLNEFPWCRFLVPGLSGYSLILDLNRQISEIIEETIEKHKNKVFQEDDFIYSFMEKIEENKETYTYEQLKVICLDLIIAGSKTTGSALEFAILLALRNPKIQNKIYHEIDTIIGDAVPSWADNSRLIYTSAFLLEVHRLNTVIPMAGPRRVLEDTEIDGYFLPKDTTVLISIADINLDPKIWEDPLEVKPERFIDENGLLKNTEHLYHFGMGYRRCLGDSLAKSFIFITFVGIMQKFRVNCCNGVLPSSEPDIGLIATPKPFTADFIRRK